MNQAMSGRSQSNRNKNIGIALLAAVGLATFFPGCTVVKPVVCAISTPWYFVESAIDTRDLDDSDDADAESLPLPCLCVAAPIVIPVRIVERIVNGFVGGLCTGLVSDLNVLVGHTEHPLKNLEHAWATNATAPSEQE